MIVTILMWVLAAVFLLPALMMLYYLLVAGYGGGKKLDHLISVAILVVIGGICLADAIKRTFP